MPGRMTAAFRGSIPLSPVIRINEYTVTMESVIAIAVFPCAGLPALRLLPNGAFGGFRSFFCGRFADGALKVGNVPGRVYSGGAYAAACQVPFALGCAVGLGGKVQ